MHALIDADSHGDVVSPRFVTKNHPESWRYRDMSSTSWPLVGNEGMNPQYTNVKVDSLIPY